MSLYQSELFKPDARSKEILKEMGEDPAQKLSQIEVLRTWIVSHNFMQCRTDDQFLLRFLRVSKFSCEGAKERILKFCVQRSSKLDGVPEWFRDQNMQDENIRSLISSGMIYLMPKPDKLGRLVAVFDMAKMGQVKVHPEEFTRAIYMVFEWIVHSFERVQINGLALVEIGSNNFDMEHLKYWTPEKMKKSVEVWQSGGMPMRMKILHYYNMPALMRSFIEIAIKFMKPKMAKRVRFHSDYKHDEDIPEECMPESLGGTAPSWAELKDHMLRDLDNFQSEFDSFKMCKVDDAKLPKNYVEGDSWGISGTFRNIDTDN